MTTSTKSIPLEKLRGLEQRLVCKLPGLKSIIAVTTPRLIKWYLVLPAVGNGDARCIFLDQLKKTHANFARLGKYESLIVREEKARLASHVQPTTPAKATKISSYKGTTTYTTDAYSIRVTRKTISERAGCGLRNYTNVCTWYAIDRNDPINSPSFSGYGGIRDALAKLEKLNTTQAATA
jgi:hypothetical protein